jgi:hypothetical protein
MGWTDMMTLMVVFHILKTLINRERKQIYVIVEQRFKCYGLSGGNALYQ